MKATLIENCTGPNPAFDPAAAIRALKAGELYEVPHTIELPAGTEINHPQAWRLCVSGALNKPPRAVPADDDCRKRVNQAQRRKQLGIENLDRVLQTSRPANQAQQKWLQQLREAYAEDLHKFDPERYPLPGSKQDSK